MSQDHPASSSQAFEEFLKAMGPKIKRLLATYRVPVEDAEDVLQQSLLALIYRWGTIRDPEGWLLVALRQHCRMYWRTHRRRLYSAVDSAILEWLSQPQAPPQERSDLLADLRSMIARLPPRCRTVLELRFQLGYEPAEVARRMGYRDKSIGKVTDRCLAALAREMLAAAPLGTAAAAGIGASDGDGEEEPPHEGREDAAISPAAVRATPPACARPSGRARASGGQRSRGSRRSS